MRVSPAQAVHFATRLGHELSAWQTSPLGTVYRRCERCGGRLWRWGDRVEGAVLRYPCDPARMQYQTLDDRRRVG